MELLRKVVHYLCTKLTSNRKLQPHILRCVLAHCVTEPVLCTSKSLCGLSLFVSISLICFISYESNSVLVYFGTKRRQKTISHMKQNQIGILSNIAEKQNYNPIFALPCPALSCRAGQGRAGHKKFDESFLEQGRAGQDRAAGQGRAKKCALWPSLIYTYLIRTNCCHQFFSRREIFVYIRI